VEAAQLQSGQVLQGQQLLQMSLSRQLRAPPQLTKAKAQLWQTDQLGQLLACIELIAALQDLPGLATMAPTRSPPGTFTSLSSVCELPAGLCTLLQSRTCLPGSYKGEGLLHGCNLITTGYRVHHSSTPEETGGPTSAGEAHCGQSTAETRPVFWVATTFVEYFLVVTARCSA
jgi:hypothetical protein